MIELPAVRVSGGGGGRPACDAPPRCCLTQRYELQGRIHGPAHQRSERALVLSAVGHRREHVFVRLRSGSDGKVRSDRDPEGAKLRIPRRRAKSTPTALQPILHPPPNRLRAMVHLRIVAPPDRADRVYAMLCDTPSAIDVIRVPNASTRPDGDLVMCDVAREDASVIISELQGARPAPRRVDLAQPDRHDLGLRRRRGRPRARLAGGRGRSGRSSTSARTRASSCRPCSCSTWCWRGSSPRSGSSSTARSWSSARWSSAPSSARSPASAWPWSRSAASSPAARPLALLRRLPARDRARPCWPRWSSTPPT